jgi:hypothetical protein
MSCKAPNPMPPGTVRPPPPPGPPPLLESPFAAARRRVDEAFREAMDVAAAAAGPLGGFARAAHNEADRLLALFPPARYVVYCGTLRQPHWCGGTEAEKVVREEPPLAAREERPAWHCTKCGDLIG